MTIHKKNRHPAGVTPRVKPQSFNKWADFPSSSSRNTYAITGPDGSTVQKVITGKAKNRILLALINGPLECASKVRFGMFVGLLRHECGLEIQTDEFVTDNQSEGGAGVYGIYTLEAKVSLVAEKVAA